MPSLISDDLSSQWSATYILEKTDTLQRGLPATAELLRTFLVKSGYLFYALFAKRPISDARRNVWALFDVTPNCADNMCCFVCRLGGQDYRKVSPVGWHQPRKNSQGRGDKVQWNSVYEPGFPKSRVLLWQTVCEEASWFFSVICISWKLTLLLRLILFIYSLAWLWSTDRCFDCVQEYRRKCCRALFLLHAFRSTWES